MSEQGKCPKCGEAHKYEACQCGDTYNVSCDGVIVYGIPKAMVEHIGYQLTERACLRRQLSQAVAEKEKAAPLLAEIERLRGLAVSTSDEGTAFYYKDAYLAEEAENKQLREQRDKLAEALRVAKRVFGWDKGMLSLHNGRVVGSIIDESLSTLDQKASETP
jgi:hypothetical protein